MEAIRWSQRRHIVGHGLEHQSLDEIAVGLVPLDVHRIAVASPGVDRPDGAVCELSELVVGHLGVIGLRACNDLDVLVGTNGAVDVADSVAEMLTGSCFAIVAERGAKLDVDEAVVLLGAEMDLGDADRTEPDLFLCYIFMCFQCTSLHGMDRMQ